MENGEGELEEMEFDIRAYSNAAGQWLSGLTHFSEPKAFCVHLLHRAPMGDGLICLLTAKWMEVPLHSKLESVHHSAPPGECRPFWREE